MAWWLKLCMLRFSSLALLAWILGADLLHSSAMLWRHPTYKVEKNWHRYYSGLIFFKKKRKDEDWQWMLAQGESSSLKKKGIEKI